MALKAKLNEIRANNKIRLEQANAQMQASVDQLKHTPTLGLAFGVALAFVALLTSLATPARAVDVDLNASIGPILESVGDLVPTIVQLMVDIVPAVIVGAVIGFIVGFFGKILGFFKF